MGVVHPSFFFFALRYDQGALVRHCPFCNNWKTAVMISRKPLSARYLCSQRRACLRSRRAIRKERIKRWNERVSILCSYLAYSSCPRRER